MQVKVEKLLEEAHTIRVSNLVKSIQLANEALTISKTLQDELLIAKCLSRLAFYTMINGSYNLALDNAEKAIAIFKNHKNEIGIADTTYTIASVYYKRDNMHLGLKYILECISIYTKHNDQANLGKCYKVMGTIYEYFEDIEKAVEAYQKSIESANVVGDVNMKTNAFNPLSGLYLNQNKIDEAMETIEESIRLKTQTGDIRGLAFAYYGRAKIFSFTNQFELAEKDFTASIGIHKEMGEMLGLAMAYFKMATMFAKRTHYSKAKEFSTAAFDISNKYGMRMIKIKSAYLLYTIHKKDNDLSTALHFLEIHDTELQANENNQTKQIINTYSQLSKVEAKALQDKLQLERIEMMEKQNKAEYTAQVKQNFLSTMSHEIRTPLNAVITIANMLKNRDDEEEQQMLDTLRFASNNLLLLINDILDFTKLDSVKVELEPKPIKLHHFMNNIANTYIGMAKEKGIRFDVEIDKDLSPYYELDEIKMAQVLGNLLSNAIKFTEKGSVTLGIEKKQVNEFTDTLLFFVSDTGVGISTDFIAELFESFSQPKSITTKKNAGSGLGLAIVKKLVQLFGTEIQFKTKVNQGSTFYFTLEVKRCTLPKQNTSSAKIELGNLKILLAEDNSVNRLVATKILSKWGAKADCAKDGKEALAMANTKKYDVILMDIHMPEMNGYDATTQIKTSVNINATTPIYALTADIMANIDKQYHSYFTGFLRKPIETDNLYKVLSSATFSN
jgi:signal transduction histidine kinase/ActR/RegA family two-component response regulator